MAETSRSMALARFSGLLKEAEEHFADDVFEGKSDSATGPHRLSRQLRPHGIGRGGGWLIWQRRRDICGRILLLRKRTTNSHEWTQSWRWKMEAPRACGQPGEGTGMNVTTCDPFVTPSWSFWCRSSLVAWPTLLRSSRNVRYASCTCFYGMRRSFSRLPFSPEAKGVPG